jgi:dolichol-phosphate mannosyltransferase
MSHLSQSQPKLVSVVIPCYNEEEVIAETVKRLSAFALGINSSQQIEFIFVDDGSRRSNTYHA